ncbi:MAG TPA: lysylphosphatidylglycerol synthase transmembrane domain-containing protein [Candidatus Eisenbacteria bacterium]|nr:lysylphosphatidylglycerol synthase transmembrane domain-containing protein [Candidatus Eisenbacteria bacterium]
MTPRWRELFHRYKVLLVGVKIALSIALFAYVVAKVSPGNVWAVVRRANPTYLAAAAALFVFSNLVGSWLWARLLRAQGVQIPYRKAAAYYFVGLFFNNFLPSNIGGDIARISDASKYATNVSSVFSATLMDRLIGVVAIALLAVLASFASLDRFHLYAIYGGIVLIFLFSLALFLSVFHRGVLKAFEWPFRVLKLRKVEEAIGRLLDDLHGFRNEKAALRAAFLASTLVQISRIYVHYLVGVSLGVRLAAGYYFLFVPVLAALVSLPISMNGLGIREGASVVLFQMAGLTREQAFTIPFVTYLMSVFISLLGGFIFVTRSPRRALARKLEARREKRAGGAGSIGREDSR